MRKQFLNSSRNNTELTISSFLQSVIPSFIRTSGKRWVEHRCAINLAQIYSERAPTNHCVGFSCPSLAISENADIVPVKCRSEDWFYFLENILCMDHTKMNHTAEKKNWQVSERLPCVDSWSKTLSTLNSFLIPTDLTAIFSCSTVTGDLVFKLFVWTNGRTRQKTLILPNFGQALRSDLWKFKHQELLSRIEDCTFQVNELVECLPSSPVKMSLPWS